MLSIPKMRYFEGLFHHHEPPMTYESKVIDQLGLVAAMIDELELPQQIDQALVQDMEQRTLSIGQAVKAMILNGLGFVNQRLYLVSQFFESKPTERLIGEGIKSEHINDDALGRALDALYDYGVTALFSKLATHATSRLGLRSRFVHLDSTSFHVDGAYNSESSPAEGVVHIRPGYSRDHRPELNQVVLALIVEQQAGIPLLMKPLSGNSSDKADFPALIQAHLDQLQQAHGVDYVVSDSALYSGDHIQWLDGQGTRFITRAPETIKMAREAIETADLDHMEPLEEGYQGYAIEAHYGSVKQRWLLVHSRAAAQRAKKTLQKRSLREGEEEVKALQKLMRQGFSCAEDATAALGTFEASLKWIQIADYEIEKKLHYEAVGRPAADAEPDRISYAICARASSSLERYEQKLIRKSMFIIATNELDEQALSNLELLQGYKGQVRVERGFRFLKDPLFLASSLFLKKEERIMALLMVMTLCLLVYAALEWRIREGLREQGQSFVDQKGQPTQHPSARWVFQYFVGIHLLIMAHQQIVLNLKDEHLIILRVLGPPYQKQYSAFPT